MTPVTHIALASVEQLPLHCADFVVVWRGDDVRRDPIDADVGAEEIDLANIMLAAFGASRRLGPPDRQTPLVDALGV